MITIEDALSLAVDAHDGQKDLDGNPVILHPITVGLAGRNREEIIAGLLHDVVEDTNYTFDDLLTHTDDLSYNEYVKRIAESGNSIAIHVKYNDLCHNLQRGRAGGHWRIVAKHDKALAIIQPLI